MKSLSLILSALALVMALPKPEDTQNLDQTCVVASRDRRAQAGPIAKEVYLPDNTTELTDTYLFQLSISEFETKRNRRDPYTLDWSSDGCTKAPDEILTFDFLPACHRHDFGLRNYRQQGRLDKTTKGYIDDQFYKDLKHECSTHSITRFFCRRVVEVYYEIVKRVGPDRALV